MFIRRTQTRTLASGEVYFTHRLVRAERVGGKVRQITLLNLGRHFELTTADWPLFCSRLRELVSGQSSLVAQEVPAAVEAAVQRYAALLEPRSMAAAPVVADAAPVAGPSWVDAESLEMLDPRTVGVESLALHAIRTLKIDEFLKSAGFNTIDLAAAVGQIVARMAHPASERKTLRWLQQSSSLGELWGYDYARLSLTRLYRVGDALIGCQAKVETALHARLSEVLELQDTIALYDLTNTYFEGLSEANPQAKRGWSKEKRSDCTLLTLGLVLDGQGFVRRSEIFAGNVGEAGTLPGMLKGLGAPAGSMVIVDRGLVSAENLSWLKDQGYRYLVMTRERLPITAGTPLDTAQGQTVHWERVIHDDGDVRLICHSADREAKEAAMLAQRRTRLEAQLEKLRSGLTTPRGSKDPAHLERRIGRLLERYPGLAQHYTIKVIADDSGKRTAAIDWTYHAQSQSRAALPGHYALRSNDLSLDGEALWRTYVQLTDVESAFRSLKSELGLRPIHHQIERRCKAHLWISVLAYQCVQYLRRALKTAGIHDSWQTLRDKLAPQQRVTATFIAKDGGTLHLRKATQPSAAAKSIYTALNLDAKPGGIQRRLFKLETDV
jgi:transposase